MGTLGLMIDYKLTHYPGHISHLRSGTDIRFHHVNSKTQFAVHSHNRFTLVHICVPHQIRLIKYANSPPSACVEIYLIVNPLHAKFFRGNINIYLHFV